MRIKTGWLVDNVNMDRRSKTLVVALEHTYLNSIGKFEFSSSISSDATLLA